MRVYSVSQINGYIKGMLDEDALLSGLFIEAEVSNFKEHSSGHLYFSLKDERSSISAVMFHGAAMGLRFAPSNGMKVIACGRVSSYEKAGTYQLYVETMEPVGLGGLYLAFNELKEKLAAEGLFDPGRKRPIPASVSVLGVVTSIDGAALRDIINVAARRNPAVKIVVAPSSVQGYGAAEEIAGAIKTLNAHGKADVIIVGRGGGSMEDLWAFNEEPVARAIASSGIPVVSAVGHETDFTISDFSADLRAPTPSAAAELCVPDARERAERLFWLWGNLNDIVEDRLYENRDSLTGFLSRLNREITHRLSNAETRAAAIIRNLNAAAPSNILRRGFAAVSIDGKTIKSVKEAEGKVGSVMTARFSDGTVTGTVTGINVLGD